MKVNVGENDEIVNIDKFKMFGMIEGSNKWKR